MIYRNGTTGLSLTFDTRINYLRCNLFLTMGTESECFFPGRLIGFPRRTIPLLKII